MPASRSSRAIAKAARPASSIASTTTSGALGAGERPRACKRGQQTADADGNAGRRNLLAGEARDQIVIAPAARDRAEHDLLARFVLDREGELRLEHRAGVIVEPADDAGIDHAIRSVAVAAARRMHTICRKSRCLPRRPAANCISDNCTVSDIAIKLSSRQYHRGFWHDKRHDQVNLIRRRAIAPFGEVAAFILAPAPSNARTPSTPKPIEFIDGAEHDVAARHRDLRDQHLDRNRPRQRIPISHRAICGC